MKSHAFLRTKFNPDLDTLKRKKFNVIIIKVLVILPATVKTSKSSGISQVLWRGENRFSVTLSKIKSNK